MGRALPERKKMVKLAVPVVVHFLVERLVLGHPVKEITAAPVHPPRLAAAAVALVALEATLQAI